MIDYAKLKALSQQIIECIGDTSEGENPKIPKQEEDINNGGQDEMTPFVPDSMADADEGTKLDAKEDATDGEQEKKKKKDSSLALMGSVLASKFK
jgi:hypothetical protein